MPKATDKFYKRDFWIQENLNYAQPHFRLEKSARIVNRIARGKACDLLDVGCGPAALIPLLDSNIQYYGIDIAIHNPAPNLRQGDFIENPIAFDDRQFDIILAQGVFEYIGQFQSAKLLEISRLLRQGGVFVASYVNFDHLNRYEYEIYNNIQSVEEFSTDVKRYFRIDSVIPTSHHWRHNEPKRRLNKIIDMHINIQLPIISSLFTVENFFVCSPLRP